MLYALSDVLPDCLSSVYARAFAAFFVSLILALCCGDRVIRLLHAHQSKGQPIRTDGPKSHLLTKQGTPTMGGVLILGAVVVAVLLCGAWDAPLLWVALTVLLVFGFVGFADDYVKVTKQTANAMTPRMKLVLQFSTALAAVGVISFLMPAEERFVLNFPYFDNLYFDLWWFYVPFAMVVIVGSSNAVNLSDGLDGLASGLSIIAFAVFMVLAYVSGLFPAGEHSLPTVPHAGEMTVVCAAVVGGCLGFLWFNAAPAKVFMGDTGSLALGGLLGTIAVMLKQEILLAIVGLVFVAEAVSVMVQVFWYRRTGKRFFKMAPIHHHFEQCGWPETRVVLRFWIIAAAAGALGLAAL